MRREQFTFYRSFWDALRALPKKEQLPFVLALCAYALDGEEKALGGAAASSFFLVKPVLDTARRKAESGRQGGSKPKANAKQGESKTQANRKQTQAGGKQTASEGEKEIEKEIEIEGEIENECLYIPPSPSDDGDAPLAGGDVVGVVEGRLGELTERQKGELAGFVRDMDEGCVLRALDAAEDAGMRKWGYVRGALLRKQAQGVRSTEDWDRAEASYQAAKGGGVGKGPVRSADCQPSPERIQKNSDWLEEFLAGQEGRTC